MTITDKNLGQRLPFPVDRVFSAAQPIPPSEFLLTELSLNGLGVTHDMNVNGSITPQPFRYTVPAGKMLLLYSLSWHLVDATILLDGFGGRAALANGVSFSIYDENDVQLFTLNEDLTRTWQFSHFGGTQALLRQGQALDSIYAKWDLPNHSGGTMYLDEGDYIEAIINDDLTTIDHFECVISGRELPIA